VKFIFPQLRKICDSRDIAWCEVDLRWGITDEQVAEGIHGVGGMGKTALAQAFAYNDADAFPGGCWPRAIVFPFLVAATVWLVFTRIEYPRYLQLPISLASGGTAAMSHYNFLYQE